ncbi:heterokaryon incompatibility protein-domain-containing protein [Podospora aff. communis PSN243]|uniref:Heterokaryon incompatibility protein-domain-containing protein n=1 Tax=Podospora aff. communis PSN243 TaxID=3040156 RepID=A0AAV9GF93_9PEZI|nr:heterokaryon incompatibility protein-domain-containing protein [Podospora aff. communis PSN243]
MAYILFRGVWEVTVMEADVPLKPSPRMMLSSMRLVRHVDRGDEAPPLLQDNEMLASTKGDPHLDLSRLKDWIAYCDTHHQGTCVRIDDPWKKVEPPLMLYLIDAEEERVSQQSGKTAYVALSYVWGASSSPLVSVKANIDELTAPKSLSRLSRLGRTLAGTIRDAMEVTRNLGFRYLWVDRLCIVQDDELHKPIQLAAMAAIYGNALVTIIADNGDDEEGLSGVGPDNSTRCPFKLLCLPGKVELVIDDPNLHAPAEPSTTLNKKTYNTRGWTLQEEMLSHRTLRFTRQEVRWMCHKSRLREIYHDDRQITENRTASIEVQLFKPQPDIMTYGHMAVDYTSRLLTYDTDAVHAFSAIIATYSKSMKAGMFYGHPELFFEVSLLWQPSKPLRRRNPDSSAPSWSFLGWQGSGLSLRAWSESYNSTARDKYRKDVYFTSAVRITPCVELYKTDTQTGERHLIQSAHHEDVDAVKEETLSDLSNRRALKVAIPTEPHPLPSRSWSQALTLRTSMCSMTVGDTLPDNSRQNHCVDVSLLDENMSIVGALRLNSTVNNVAGMTVSLIVLSRGITLQRPHTWEMPEMNVFHAECDAVCFHMTCRAEKRYVPYDFYNVMWVRLVDGFAHREGVGRVLRSVWGGLKAEDVEIQLG